METYPVDKIYRQIEPGSVLLVCTENKGVPNVMTMGFQMMIQHAPPLIGAIVGPWDYSYKALVKNQECVLSIPGIDIIEKVVDIGNCSGHRDNKFEKFSLTVTPASIVQAPMIEDCLFNIECKVANTELVDQYNLFVLEAVAAWKNSGKDKIKPFHHHGNGVFSTEGESINLQYRMTKWKIFQD